MTPASFPSDEFVTGPRDAAAATVRLFAALDRGRANDDFVLALAHDLRAPLRAVDAYAAALIEDHAEHLPAAVLDLVQRIRQATATMDARVEGLTRLTRLGERPLYPVTCDLAPVAARVLHGLRHAEPTRDVETLLPASIRVAGDASLLGIAIENLLTNAWKFTRGRPGARIEVFVHDDGEDLIISVRDNGVGFDMRQAHRLGLPFQRLHDARAFEGTGLGLASARRIVERHGGRLWAFGIPGEGATFHLALPSVTRR